MVGWEERATEREPSVREEKMEAEEEPAGPEDLLLRTEREEE